MQYRKLGATDLSFSEVCFGPMRYDPNEKNDDGQNALDRAVECGINVVHSSYEYSTIEQLGESLRTNPKRKELHHIIKVSSPDYGEEKFDKQLFRRRIEDALRVLHTERIDVVQHLHRSVTADVVYHAEGNGPRLAQFAGVIEGLTEAFAELKQEGKVGYLASFPMTVEYAQRVVDSGKFQAIAAYYNLVETEMTQFFPAMEQQGMGFIAIRPLLRGLLTDKRVNRNALPDGDPMQESKWDGAYDLLDTVRKAMPQPEVSWESFAIKFCLGHPMVTTVALGLNTPAQVDAAVAAADGNYPDLSLVEKLAAAVSAERPETYAWPPYK